VVGVTLVPLTNNCESLRVRRMKVIIVSCRVDFRPRRVALIGAPSARAAWLRPKQTDLVPGKGQFRSRFPQSAQLRLSDNDFSGSPQPTPT